MKKIVVALSALLILSYNSTAQQDETDSLKSLDEVTVKAFEQNRKVSNSVAVVKIIEFNNGDRYNKTSLVNGFNTVS
ncbi:MAG: hypothetical protein KA428_13365, partial [Chitinophagaceae bacterium]|nr:hypothetical protein [Chitinophagaceae bacterium]